MCINLHNRSQRFGRKVKSTLVRNCCLTDALDWHREGCCVGNTDIRHSKSKMLHVSSTLKRKKLRKTKVNLFPVIFHFMNEQEQNMLKKK